MITGEDSVGEMWIEPAQAIGTQTVGDTFVGLTGQVDVHMLPIVLVVSDFFTTGTDGKNAGEFGNFFLMRGLLGDLSLDTLGHVNTATDVAYKHPVDIVAGHTTIEDPAKSPIVPAQAVFHLESLAGSKMVSVNF